MTRGPRQADSCASEARVPESPPSRGGSGGAGGQAGGCIILADSEASVPAELLAGLSRRGMAVSVVTDSPAAMVRLAREGAAAMLVAAGVTLPGYRDLLDAVRRYHPGTGCWAYDRAEGGIRLSRVGGSAGGAARESPPDAGAPGAPTVAAPHAAGGATASAARGQASNGNGNGRRSKLDGLVLHLPGAELAPDEPLVTEEELAMLLASGVGEDEGPVNL